MSEDKSKLSKSVLNFFKEVKSELKKVHWPSRQEALKLTIIVVVISIVLAGFISLSDFIFTQVLNLAF